MLPNRLSPRVWGTRCVEEVERFFIRFIPTCVGNSTAAIYHQGKPPVHPHVCGELEPTKIKQVATNGSSPRVWGTPAAVS